jgi:mRNA-degrading endonuclease toxin of MazEF toxin-antitoxin module
MAYAQGSVVLIEDPYRDGLRPVLVVSNADRPYQGKQYTVAVVTRTEREEAIEVSEAELSEGDLDYYPTYVNPWSLHEFEHEDVDRRVAQVSNTIIREVGLGVYRFVERR